MTEEYKVGQQSAQQLSAVFTFYDADGNVIQETPVVLIPKEVNDGSIDPQ